MTAETTTRTLYDRVRRFVDLPPRPRALVEHAPSVPLRTIIRRFWPYARPYRPYLVLNLVLIVLVPAVEAAQIWMFKLAVDEVLVPREFSPFLWIAAAYLSLTVLGGILSFGDAYLSTWIGEGFVRSLRVGLFRHVQGLSLDFFERRRLGDVLTRVTGDVASVETFVLSGVAQLLAYAVEIAIFASLLFYLRWELAVTSLVVIPIAWVATRSFTRRVKQASREKRRRTGALTAVAEESFTNVQLVQAYNRQETEIERFEEENLATYKAELAATRVKAAFSPAVDLLRVIGALTVIGAGTWELQRGRLTLGGLMIFLTYLGSLYSPIRGLSRLGTSIFAASAGAERIIELLDEQPVVTERPDARTLGWTRGAVEFDAVSFRYSEHGRDALSDVTFRLEPGETLALVGRSGAGKSTLAKLLLRFYDPASGAIRIDGVDLRDVRLASLRSHIALLLQETLVFEGTIWENIAYGRLDAFEDQIVAAAKGADAHDFICSLEDGYDTLVGERGQRLSGGQRQRIAIARAMIRDAPVLILDEPTTGLDAESAERILGPLQRLMQNRTTIVITHNLVTVRHATSVLVLEEGRVVEHGTHAELLAQGGTYAELYRVHHPEEQPSGLSLVEPR